MQGKARQGKASHGRARKRKKEKDGKGKKKRYKARSDHGREHKENIGKGMA